MSELWRSLFRENPMNIESLRAVRRLTATGGARTGASRHAGRVILGVIGTIYLWLLFSILVYKEDISLELLYCQFFLLTALIPASLYEAISGERERLTWDSLILTRLSPARILVGKLTWRLLMAGGIILLFQPPLLLAHFVTKFKATYSLPDLYWTQLCLVCWCAFVAAFTLWVSARTKRSVTTLAVVAMTLIAGLVLVPALYGAFNTDEQAWRVNQEVPALVTFAAGIVRANPGFVISHFATSGGAHGVYDRQFFWLPALLQSLPVIYLGLAALCLAGTLRALARLGLPTRGVR
jgi:hypothetical protein